MVRDSAGISTGTTFWGGANSTYGGVYKLAADGTETVLHSFNQDTGGYHPVAGLVRDSSGNLYGTTLYGGKLSCVIQQTATGCGVVFKINKKGKEVVLHRFKGSDGGWLTSDLLLDSQGNLYGTTSTGTNNYGTVFEIKKSGKFTVLHAFMGTKNDGNTRRAP